MVKLRELVDTEEVMEKFITDYRIPPNVSLRHCKMGEWHLQRRTDEVVIPILAFVEWGMRIPMGPIMRITLGISDWPPLSAPPICLGFWVVWMP